MIRAIGIGLALFVGLNGGRASAMTSDTSTVRCSVERAGKLPEGLSSQFICDTVRRAVGPALEAGGIGGAELSVQVIVESVSKLTATATVAGKTLPEHHLGTSDRPLNARAISMLASAIAADVAALRR